MENFSYSGSRLLELSNLVQVLESVALITRVESAGSDSDSDERFSQWKLCTKGRGEVLTLGLLQPSANSILSARAREDFFTSEIPTRAGL